MRNISLWTLFIILTRYIILPLEYKFYDNYKDWLYFIVNELTDTLMYNIILIMNTNYRARF